MEAYPVSEMQRMSSVAERDLSLLRSIFTGALAPGAGVSRRLPLPFRLTGDDVSITRLLRSRADPNSKNAAAVPPLHLAAFHGHNTTVALLAASRAFVNQGDCFQVCLLLFFPSPLHVCEGTVFF